MNNVSTSANIDFVYQSTNGYKVSIANKDDDVIMSFPDGMMKELGWQENDELEFTETEMLTDDGEYPSFCLINKTLEERLKDV